MGSGCTKERRGQWEVEARDDCLLTAIVDEYIEYSRRRGREAHCDVWTTSSYRAAVKKHNNERYGSRSVCFGELDADTRL